jgi:hypothetical protein
MHLSTSSSSLLHLSSTMKGARPMSSRAMQATAVVRPDLFIGFSTRAMPSPLAICVVTQRVAGVKRLWLLQTILEMSVQRVMLWQTTKISTGQSQRLFNKQEKEK